MIKGIVGVTLDGAFAEYMIVDAGESSKVPDKVAFETAAPMACAGVAIWGGLLRANLKAGETVAIVGAGGMLGLGCQFGRALGLQVISIDATYEALQLAKTSGANAAIDAGLGNDKVVEVVKMITNGEGADATINIVDATRAAGLACAVTKKHGLMVQNALHPSDFSIPVEQFIYRDIRVHGSWRCSRADAQRMLDLVAEKDITVNSNPFFGLEELPKLIDRVRSGSMAGKPILIVDKEEIKQVKERLEIS